MFFLLLQVFCLLGKGGRNVYLAADEFHASTDQSFLIEYCREPVAGKGMEIRNLRRCKMLSFSIFENRFRERMFTFFLQGKCHGEKLLFGDSVCREQISNFRLAAGNRTGFVQGNDLNLAGLFERNGSFEQDTISGPHSVADHDRYRSGEVREHMDN